jgi:hypothetical protein
MFKIETFRLSVNMDVSAKLINGIPIQYLNIKGSWFTCYQFYLNTNLFHQSPSHYCQS